MWISSGLHNVGSAILVAISQRRVLSWVFGVVLWCLRVTSLQEESPDIPNMAACTGKLFHLTFGSHPVFGRPHLILELAAMSPSADDQIPAWLSFNSSSRSLSGVPLPGDEGSTRLTIAARCPHISAAIAGCADHPRPVFQLTVSRCSWPDSQVSSFSVANPVVQVATVLSSPEYGRSHVMLADAGCEGARVVASLVLCSTSEQLTSRDRLNLMLHLSDFLAIPVGSISLVPSSAGLLTAVNSGFHMVSAGPGSDGCNLNHNIELLWWLPCSTVKHLSDFITVLQHNVDGGRLQQEIGRAIMGWYVASSSSLVSRPSRRRRAAGYRTAVPTPVLIPLKPTSLVVAAQVESAVTSSTDQAESAVTSSTDPISRTVPFTAEYTVIVPESSKQTPADVPPPAVVSTSASLWPGYLAETTHLPSLSRPLSSSDVTSSLALTSTRTITSQQLTQLSWTARLWESRDTSTAQFTADATFSYLSAQQFAHSHFISSPSTPDLPVSFVRVPSDRLSTPDLATSFIRVPSDLSYTPSLPTSYVHIPPHPSSSSDIPTSFVRVPSDLSSTLTTQYNRQLEATPTLGHTVLQLSTHRAISNVTPEIPQATPSADIFPLSLTSSGTREHFTSGLFPADNASASSSLLYLSSASTDWLQEPVTESSTSFMQDKVSFIYIQTPHPPPQMSFPEATPTGDMWVRSSQMSDPSTLLTSVATLQLASAYLVISRDVQVVAPLLTSRESVLAVHSSTDVLPLAPDATSVTPDTDWRGKPHSPAYAGSVWNTGIREQSNIPTLQTRLSFDEQSQELDHSFLPRWFPVPELPTLLHSSQTQIASQPSSMLPLHTLYTSYRSASASEVVADWELVGKSGESKMSTMMVEWDLPQLGVLASIRSQVVDSSHTITRPSVYGPDNTPPAYLSVHDDKMDQSTVATEAIGSSASGPWLDTTGATESTTSVTTPVSSSFLFLTSAATKRPRTGTTTPVVTGARTSTTTTTTTRAATTKQRSSTTQRPTGRKHSTHKARPTIQRTTQKTTQRTTQKTTQRSTQRTTQRTTTECCDEDEIYPDHFNNRPYVQRPIMVIRADQGKLLEFIVPHDVFYDIEDGDTRHLSLSLELPSNQVLPDNFWLYIDPTPQVIKALALHEDMDVKNMSVALVARDKQGLAAADYITLQINDTPRTSFTHVFRMKFAVGFLQFMHSRRNITELVEKIGNYFGDNGARLMTVLEVRPGSFMMSWTNHSLTGATCPSDVIRHLYTQMVRRDGTVRQTFSRHIGRHLHLKEVQLQPWGSCIAAPATTATSTSTSTKSTSTHLVSEVKGHGFSVWAHVILPVLIAVLVFILIILIIVFCNRRRRQRLATLNAEKEAISIDGNPVIFPRECEPEDLSSKTGAPNGSSAADLQPSQNVPAGSSQVKNNLNRDQERARRSRDNREQEWLNKDAQVHEEESDRDWSRNVHRKHTRDCSSGRRHRDPDRTSRVSASSTLSWDRPNNHYLEEEAGSRSSTLKSTKSAGSDKRHRRSPPPYWHYQTDPPPYRMPPPYLSNNTTQM